MKHLLAVLLALAVCTAAAAGAADAPPAGIAWHAGDVDSAFARARRENKPLFLYWGAVWCPYCNQVKATLFTRQDFIARSRLFVPVYIYGDAPAAQKIGARFKVSAYLQQNWLHRLGLFVLFLVCGFAILVFGSNYFEIFPTNKNLTYNLTISALFLIVALWLKRDQYWNRYWRIAYAFFVASIAFPVTLLLGRWDDTVLGWFNVTVETSQGIGIAKTYEMILVVAPILLLTKLSGADFGSIYLKRGSWKLSLGIGALVFFNFAISALMFLQSDTRVRMFSARRSFGDSSFRPPTVSWKKCGCAASF